MQPRIIVTGEMSSDSFDATLRYLQGTNEDVSGGLLIVVAVVAAAVGIFTMLLPCFMWCWLKAADLKLDSKYRYVGGDMCCLYWLICLCCGFWGTVVFYIQAMNQIKMRMLVMEKVGLAVEKMSPPGLGMGGAAGALDAIGSVGGKVVTELAGTAVEEAMNQVL